MTALQIISATDLPGDPVDAAARFFDAIMPQVRAAEAGLVIIHFSPAGHEHDAWRLAAVQDLAREAAPRRINAIVGAVDQKAALEAATEYATKAPGVTGQVLTLDGLTGEKG